MTDRYYTPSNIAAMLCAACPYYHVNSVADFSAGDGALLSAAHKRWPSARLFGCDIDSAALALIRGRLPDAELFCADFLDSDEWLAKGGRDAESNQHDVILLNPPFSNRREKAFSTKIAGIEFKCTKVFAFIAAALSHLKVNGKLIAIVPSYCLENEIDSSIREHLVRLNQLTILTVPILQAFDGCQVWISIISLSARRPIIGMAAANRKTSLPSKFPNIRVMRGSLSVVAARWQKTGIPFCHSTDLGTDFNPLRVVDATATSRIVEGTAILIPRVGRPKRSTVCLSGGSSRIALSDCVVALQLVRGNAHQELAASLFEDWSEFLRIYRGTGAQFVTVRRLCDWLSKKGLHPAVVNSMDWSDPVSTDTDAVSIPVNPPSLAISCNVLEASFKDVERASRLDESTTDAHESAL
jgi:hypothetical protein